MFRIFLPLPPSAGRRLRRRRRRRRLAFWMTMTAPNELIAAVEFAATDYRLMMVSSASDLAHFSEAGSQLQKGNFRSA
ncbi:hypothetical protein M5D96_007006 [Drosophila gunungcola]|uniref:Uncharacterized protein n=1 Tax=Drosophila gunungcola TaxID=103775 RepID=A0A9P9YME7_9MUSC|nr:hypothetical protein M5D96_007006 [Drosophila gunungcola]